MKLPNRDRAYVPRPKLKDYLLSRTHPVGSAKSRFFRALGFDEANAGLLEESLISIAKDCEVVDVVSSVHGTKYVIDGTLQGPVGIAVRVRTVWIIDAGQDDPRFVTAYPA